MLLNAYRAPRRWLPGLALALGATVSASAQSTAARERDPASPWVARPAPVLPRRPIDPVAPLIQRPCETVARCTAERSDADWLQHHARRGLGRRRAYALAGLVAGAATGWGWFWYRCTTGEECYSPLGGIMLAGAGGAVGMVIGLLLAPTPEP